MRAEYVAKRRALALNTGFCVGGKERGGVPQSTDMKFTYVGPMDTITEWLPWSDEQLQKQVISIFLSYGLSYVG